MRPSGRIAPSEAGPEANDAGEINGDGRESVSLSKSARVDGREECASGKRRAAVGRTHEGEASWVSESGPDGTTSGANTRTFTQTVAHEASKVTDFLPAFDDALLLVVRDEEAALLADRLLLVVGMRGRRRVPEEGARVEELEPGEQCEMRGRMRI